MLPGYTRDLLFRPLTTFFKLPENIIVFGEVILVSMAVPLISF